MKKASGGRLYGRFRLPLLRPTPPTPLSLSLSPFFGGAWFDTIACNLLKERRLPLGSRCSLFFSF